MKTVNACNMNTASHENCAYQCGSFSCAEMNTFVRVVLGAACTFLFSLVLVAIIINSAIISAIICVIIIMMTTGYLPKKLLS